MSYIGIKKGIWSLGSLSHRNRRGPQGGSKPTFVGCRLSESSRPPGSGARQMEVSGLLPPRAGAWPFATMKPWGCPQRTCIMEKFILGLFAPASQGTFWSPTLSPT